MDEDAIQRQNDEVRAGLAALKQGRRDEAEFRFQRSLAYLEDVEDPEKRRRELGTSALLFVKANFPNLGLTAAREAIALDERLRDMRHLAEDLNTYAWAQMQLGQIDDAATNFRRALDLCLANGDYDNAASTSTNLAIIIGQRDRMDEAIDLLWNSLDYLKIKQHDDTERITRIALIQALEAERRDPERAFVVARDLFDRFTGDLREDQWRGALEPLEQTIDRYLGAHPELRPEAWKQARFPELARVASHARQP